MDNAPQPETLQRRTADSTTATAAPPPAPPGGPLDAKKPRRTFRPSHRATFIGLGAVMAILAINAAVFTVLLKKQAANDTLAKGQVSISTADLNKLGINRNSVGDTGILLTVAPNAQFKGKLTVASDTTLSGQVNVNGKLTGTSASLTQLQAGNTSLAQLAVNGDGTFSNLNLRQALVVAGTTNLQGAVTIGQLLTVNNSINVLGNLSIGGTFSARSLASTSTLTVGGHLITSGPTPGVSRGGAVGSNGTVSISGNDAAGVISINIGVGAVAGTLASVTFTSLYGIQPRVVVTAIGVAGNFYLSGIGAGGFSVAVGSGLPPGGYQIDYIVEQ
jgi:hypothetical protein